MPPTKDGRVTKSKAQKAQTSIRRAKSTTKSLPLVERTNALSIEDFIAKYMTPPTPNPPTENQSTVSEANDSNAIQPPLDVYSAATISPTDLEACLDLIELTSGEAYTASGGGWSRPAKRKEMKLPDMKYLIVRGSSTDTADEPSSSRNSVLGFLSFMSNATAREFYRKGGYVVDEYSPKPRRLRNGTVKEFDYEILSKGLK
ncbi:uncharacterized protein N7498_006546 [Penicillium cinerascens]|uniref:N-acetyltransferase domain-containing protein n=1 Tax=Penicillium cinerascens TaxID=70096 RepID=A0A9W9MIG1_9EURO|nr:uncharacterized protein N7498_006546 [Penicillium cinerascens]KAJ5201883.1 hypothetical protein N7498_006546 [Penicillium cinerascens]